MAMSSYLASTILNAVFRNLPFSPPSTVYVALYTSDPTDDDTGTEVSGGGYSRQEVTFSSPIAKDGRTEISNDTEIVFGPATEDWGTVTHVGLRDASTGGNLLYYGPLTVPHTVSTDQQLRFAVGGLTLTLD